MTFGTFEVAQRNGRVHLSCDDVTVEVPAERRLPSEVVVGVRPERVTLWRQEDGLLGPLEGRVQFVEDLGREKLINVRISEQIAFLVQADEPHPIALDDTVRIGLRTGHIHIFDPGTGDAICRL
jgi:multiple sugar transport system ATP-binding protein